MPSSFAPHMPVFPVMRTAKRTEARTHCRAPTHPGPVCQRGKRWLIWRHSRRGVRAGSRGRRPGRLHRLIALLLKEVIVVDLHIRIGPARKCIAGSFDVQIGIAAKANDGAVAE